MIPVMMLAVTADESYPALNKILDDKLVNDLNRINGVGSVSVMGVPEREVQVNVDPKKIEAYGLSVEQIGSIIAARTSTSRAVRSISATTPSISRPTASSPTPRRSWARWCFRTATAARCC